MHYSRRVNSAIDQVISNKRVSGLDSLRIAALVLITWQHAASSIFDAYAETQWRGISPGQTGVAIFCAISGFLAFRTVPSALFRWYQRRLLTIFPAYWIVTIAAFVLTLIWGTKPVTTTLFVSQMLGLGYFTHGWELINVVSWFVSLILLCYTLSLVAWRTGRQMLFWWLVAALSVVVIAMRIEVPLSRHVLAFALGAIYSNTQFAKRIQMLSVAMIGTGIVLDPQFFYAGFAVLALDFATRGKLWEPGPFQRASTYAYEYFLIHGICLAIVSKLVSNGLTAVFLAIGAAALGAFVLHHLINKAMPLLLGRW